MTNKLNVNEVEVTANGNGELDEMVGKEKQKKQKHTNNYYIELNWIEFVMSARIVCYHIIVNL